MSVLWASSWGGSLFISGQVSADAFTDEVAHGAFVLITDSANAMKQVITGTKQDWCGVLGFGVSNCEH